MTIDRAMLQPAVALAAWTLIMLVWLLATRLPAMKKAGIDMRALVGTKAADSDRALPAEAQWKAHNYMHLLEQPVLFYAMVVMLALVGANDFPTRVAAWGYVTFRIVHSIQQATVNRVPGRFALFGIATLLLIFLTVRAGLAVWDVPVPW